MLDSLLVEAFNQSKDLISIFDSAGDRIYANNSTLNFYNTHLYDKVLNKTLYKGSYFFPFLESAISYFKDNPDQCFFIQNLEIKEDLNAFLHLELQKVLLNNSVFYILKIRDITELTKNTSSDTKIIQLNAVSHILQHDLKSAADDLTFVLDYLLEYEYDYTKAIKNTEIDILKFFQQALNKNKITSEALKDWLAFINSGILYKEYTNITKLIKATARNNLKNNVEIAVSNFFPNLFINKNQIKILIDNLIKNGIKYNNKQIKKIKVFYSKKEEAIIIKDNGIGFPVDRFESLLKPFERGTNGYTGMGLGLTICNQIVKNHGWSLKVEAKSNIYTKMYIVLKNN